jgi:acetyl-CoA carboxylase carboxyl transferase subunit beta
MEAPVAAAGAVIRDRTGRLLVVRRRNPPAAGSWSLPGGRVEPGETPAQAAAREVHEETGLTVAIGEQLARLSIGGFDVRDFAATVTGGTLAAGDDATEARWVTLAELATMPTSDRLVEHLAQMGVADPPTAAG